MLWASRICSLQMHSKFHILSSKIFGDLNEYIKPDRISYEIRRFERIKYFLRTEKGVKKTYKTKTDVND